MKTFKLILSAIIATLIISSCSKEKSGSGIRYKLRASNAGINQPGDLNLTARPLVTINWTSGFANVTAISFEAESNAGEIEYRSTIDHHVDIFDPVAVLGVIPIPPGTYEQVEFKAKLAPTSSEPAFEIRGDYNGTPVVLRVQNPFEFETEKENVTIDPNNNYTSTINLQLAQLTAGITDAEMAAAQQTNGEIIISSTSNPELYQKIVRNLDDCEHGDFDDDDQGEDDDD